MWSHLVVCTPSIYTELYVKYISIKPEEKVITPNIYTIIHGRHDSHKYTLTYVTPARTSYTGIVAVPTHNLLTGISHELEESIMGGRVRKRDTHEHGEKLPQPPSHIYPTLTDIIKPSMSLGLGTSYAWVFAPTIWINYKEEKMAWQTAKGWEHSILSWEIGSCLLPCWTPNLASVSSPPSGSGKLLHPHLWGIVYTTPAVHLLWLPVVQTLGLG